MIVGMGRPKLNREQISLTLPKGMAEELAEVAAKKGITRSDLIERHMERLVRRARTLGKKKG
jgi:metal-responsive CopG/Arc/MetJ family transcriptional regulator